MEAGRRLGDRRLRARWHLRARDRRHAARRPAANRLSLSLRLRDDDRRRGTHHLVPNAGDRRMTWPILSIVIFLPLVGAAFILPLHGDEEGIRNNARWTALGRRLLVFC